MSAAKILKTIQLGGVLVLLLGVVIASGHPLDIEYGYGTSMMVGVFLGMLGITGYAVGRIGVWMVTP